MFKKITFTKDSVLLSSVIFATILLRLIRLNDLFHFTYDEEIFAFVGKRIIVNAHIPLIGGVTPFHVHLSPFFYWLSAFFLFLSKLNPLGWGVASAIISGLTILILHMFVKEAFTKRIAILSIIFYCFSIYTNILDRHYWGLFFNPIISILILYSLFKIVRGNYLFFLLLSCALSFGFHTDPSTIIFFPLILLVVWLYKIPLTKNRYAKGGLLIFLLSFLPLIIFDLRHNFVNIKGIFQYVSEAKSSSGFSVNRLIDSIVLIPNLLTRIIPIQRPIDLAYEYSYCSKYVSTKLTNIPFPLTILSIIIILFALFKKSTRKNEKDVTKIFNIFLLSSLFGVIIYKGLLGRPFFEHYLSTLIPLFIIFMAQILDEIINKAKIFGIIIILIFITANLLQLIKVKHSYGYRIKNEAVKWAINNTVGDFALESLSNCFRYNGYRYLFYLYGREPVKSYVDQNLFWLYDKTPSYKHPPLLVVMVAGDYKDNPKLEERYKKYKEYLIKSKSFKDLEVLIIDNTKEIIYEF